MTAHDPFEGITAPVPTGELHDQLDLDWLRELMMTEHLRPEVLCDADEMGSALSQRVSALINDEELRRLWLKHDNVTDIRFRMLEDFWLRLGLKLGALMQWRHDNIELVRLVNDDAALRPDDYIGAVTAAAQWVDAETALWDRQPTLEWLDAGKEER